MGKEIGPNYPPFYVAELSQNYRNLDEAYRLMKACKEAGADAIKIQLLMPDEITIDCDKTDFICKYGLWKGKRLYDLYETNSVYINDLFNYASNINIPIFSSVFGLDTLKFLEEYDCPAYKISSFENNWPELIHLQ